MKISSTLTIEIDGAKFHFEQHGLNIWTTIDTMKQLDLPKQIDVVLSKLKDMDGVTIDDKPLTVDELKAKPEHIPVSVYSRLFLAWFKSVNQAVSGEAEEEKSTAA